MKTWRRPVDAMNGVTGWTRRPPSDRSVASHAMRCRVKRSAPIAASSGLWAAKSPHVIMALSRVWPASA